MVHAAAGYLRMFCQGRIYASHATTAAKQEQSLDQFVFFCTSLAKFVIAELPHCSRWVLVQAKVHLRSLLSAIQRVEANVYAKLTHMKRELMDERESADECMVKKIRLDMKPTFRKKSLEMQ